MTISQFRSKLYHWAKVLGDVQAVRKGRVARRVAQRIAGKRSRRLLNRIK